MVTERKDEVKERDETWAVELDDVLEDVEVWAGFPFTLKKIAAELVKEGVEVYQWLEKSDGGFPYSPTLRFHGDEQEGQRAAQIVIDYGLPVFQLSRTWSYLGPRGMMPTYPEWKLEFPRSMPRSADMPD